MVLASSGNSESAVTVLSLFAGSAIVHNFQLASSATGPSANGRVFVFVCIVVIVIIATINSKGLVAKGE